MEEELMNGKSKISTQKSLNDFEIELPPSEEKKGLFSKAVVESENKLEKLNSLSILTISEVAAKLKLLNNATAKRWLERKGVLIHKFSKQNIVYEIEVICEIDKPFVKSLKLKYPSKWKKIYRNLVKDENAYDLMVLQLDGEFDFKPTTKVKRNVEDEKLYNDLMK